MKKLTLCGLLVVLTACTSSAQQARRPTPADVVATVGSQSITLAEVDDKALEAPTANFGGKLSQALYDARRGALEEIIASALMDNAAKAQGIDRAALVEKEITSKVTAVTDAEIAAWYQANPAQVRGAPLEQVRQPIRTFLTQERMQKIRGQYIDDLKSKTAVRVLLDPPRQKVTMAAASPARGPKDAPIQIVEFSDFQCPFCFRVGPSLKQVFDTYGDRIHLIYREYPLPNHPNARPASEAGLCANEQGKFWPYHDRVFASQQKLAPRTSSSLPRSWGSTPRASTPASTRTSTPMTWRPTSTPGTRPASTAPRRSSSTAGCSAARSRSRSSRRSSTTSWPRRRSKGSFYFLLSEVPTARVVFWASLTCSSIIGSVLAAQPFTSASLPSLLSVRNSFRSFRWSAIIACM